MAQRDVIRLKLLIDSDSERVLFAEADKNFIDFLFNFRSLPLGAVMRLLKNQSMVWGLGNLYETVETLNDTYLQPNQISKDSLLKPTFYRGSSAILLPDDAAVVTYIVMDDLSVMPMSAISCLSLLNKFNVTKVDGLEEKLITLDVNEGVKLLKASLQSNTVLIDVLFGRMTTTITVEG